MYRQPVSILFAMAVCLVGFGFALAVAVVNLLIHLSRRR